MKKYLTLGFIALALSSCASTAPAPVPLNVSGQWNMILTNEKNNNASLALTAVMNDANGAILGTLALPGQPSGAYPFSGNRTPSNTATMNILYSTVFFSITGTFANANSFLGRFTTNLGGEGPVTMNR